jgi:hypothetical protein
VDPPAYRANNERLFMALEALFPADFLGKGSSDHAADAVLLVGAARAHAVVASDHGLPCLAVPAEPDTNEAPRARSVRFSGSDAAPRLLRHRLMWERRSPAPGAPVPADSGEVVIATCNGDPAWIRRPASAGAGAMDLTSVALPRLSPERLLSQCFNREQFLGVLPILNFLKTICAESEWSIPPLRASLVFDDVNLRWSTYGCLNFRALAESARERGYHAGLAVIPLDAGSVQQETAALFRERSDQLSILIHGNKHLKFELVRDRPALERIAILAEARQRMSNLAKMHRLSVCAVAEPPYGIFRSNYVQALAALQYEAVLCTFRQFLQCNPASAQSPSFGLDAVECMPSGLAMIPRIPAAAGWETESVLAAFLGQPVVIAGHHFDADRKLSFVEQLVDQVNGLGPVNWSNLSDVAASRFVWRKEGATVRIRAFSRRIVASIPDGVNAVVVERPWIDNGSQEVLNWRPLRGEVASQRCPEVSESFPVVGGQTLEIISPIPHPVDPQGIVLPLASPWPVLRRALAEARDRCYPYLPSALRSMPGLLDTDD